LCMSVPHAHTIHDPKNRRRRVRVETPCPAGSAPPLLITAAAEDTPAVTSCTAHYTGGSVYWRRLRDPVTRARSITWTPLLVPWSMSICITCSASPVVGQTPDDVSSAYAAATYSTFLRARILVGSDIFSDPNASLHGPDIEFICAREPKLHPHGYSLSKNVGTWEMFHISRKKTKGSE
jgi:hypothetical protein